MNGWLTCDQLLARLERSLRRQGAGFDDIDACLAAELDVTLDDWFGYHRVRHAAERYQTRQQEPDR